MLTVDGVLDSRTYLQLRNRIIEKALDEPRAVLVDVNALRVPASCLLPWHCWRFYVSQPRFVPCVLHGCLWGFCGACWERGARRWSPIPRLLQC